MPSSGGHNKPAAAAGRPRGNKSKRTRQTSSLQQMVVDEGDEDEQTLETVPDHLSTSASEASSKASTNSQPPLLDFIGTTCLASAWFTSCFPCAVVDINDSDDYVVDKLSRESAMNVMYANKAVNKSVLPDSGGGRVIQAKHSDQEENMMFIRLPESDKTQNHAQIPIHSVPSVIQEGSEDDDVMDEISLDDDESKPLALGTRTDSGIVDRRVSPVVPAVVPVKENPIYAPPKDPSNKKKFSVKKMFGRKKKA